MTFWFIVLGLLYAAALVYCAQAGARKTHGDAQQFLTAGSSLGATLGLLTYAATLFSTFTLIGMPDFFRTQGVGSWTFLMVGNTLQAFVILAFGLALRRRVAAGGYTSVCDIVNDAYRTRLAGGVYLLGVLIFLVPYVAIQVRGVGIFLTEAAPIHLPMWLWALLILLFMLAYSSIGGLRAIMYSDAIQGLVLLVVTWIIAVSCVLSFGGVEAMFAKVGEVNAPLLSTPGPNGMLGWQFIFASMLGVTALPISQPHLTVRVGIMKSARDLKQMAVALGVFAAVIILPTSAIGFYGAVRYAELPPAPFIVNAIVRDQPAFIGALAILGLMAAAMSTADSQIFAVGSEARQMLPRHRGTRQVKIIMAVFAAAAFVMAVASSDQLVLLALISFRGTALMAPMILVAVLCPKRAGVESLAVTLLAMTVFLLWELHVIEPRTLTDLRIELWLMIATATLVAASATARRG